MLTLAMAFMEITAIPASLFFNISILDINSIYFTLMLNFLIALTICFVCKKFLIKDWNFGLHLNGIFTGLRKYGLPSLISTIIIAIAFCVGLSPLDNKPTALRVIVEGIIYYIGVAILEEVYLRGLLQNIIEKWFDKRKNATLYAVIITSFLFGVGHIVGALEQPLFTIIAKTIWATALGIYFGAVYIKTRNLWVPVILHFVVDLCGIPFCFTTSNQYPLVALIACLVSYTALGFYGLIIVKKQMNKKTNITIEP